MAHVARYPRNQARLRFFIDWAGAGFGFFTIIAVAFLEKSPKSCGGNRCAIPTLLSLIIRPRLLRESWSEGNFVFLPLLGRGLG